MRKTMKILAACALLPVAASAGSETEPSAVEAEVAAVERAFAQTMADRDHAAFTQFLSDEAIFLAGPEVRRGKQAVAEAWKAYFEGDVAPFSWEPATVVVLESGVLALSTGPVRDASGNLVAYYTSVWRREEAGTWRIVLDKGNKACDQEAEDQAGSL